MDHPTGVNCVLLRYFLGDEKMKKLFALMLVVTGLVIAGCAKSEETPPADTTTTPPAETPAETPPAEDPAK
jgi:hypothetical protein